MVTTCGLTEFVGTSKTGDTIGLVIANVDQQVLDAMQLKKKISFYRYFERLVLVQVLILWPMTKRWLDKY